MGFIYKLYYKLHTDALKKNKPLSDIGLYRNDSE